MAKRKDTDDFTQRVLMSLVVDVVAQKAAAEKMFIEVGALAREYGVKMPEAEDVL